MKARHYTIGEIARLKLLIGTRGKPLTDTAGVLRALKRRFPELAKKQTLHGMGYDISQVLIDRFNKSRV